MADIERLLREAENLLGNSKTKDAAYSIVNVVKTTNGAKTFKINKRKLTEVEIDDIIEVVDVFPTRVEELGKMLQERQRQIIRSKLRVKDVVDHPDIVNRLKGKLRSYWYRGIIPAGTPLGYIVADDSAAAVMQGTLNTRHKPGSKQNASGGIQNQREVIMLSVRSVPVIIAGFKNRQSFSSIMEYWRPKWTETTLQLLTSSLGDRGVEIIPTPVGWVEPDWWKHFRYYFNLKSIPEDDYIDIESGGEVIKKKIRRDYVIQYRLDRRLLLTYGVTLTKVRDSILGTLKKTHANAVEVYFTPLTFNEVLIHIIPHPKAIAEYGRPGMPAEIAFFEKYRQEWATATITGLEGVKSVLPLPKRVIEAIRNEKVEGDTTILNLMHNVERFFGVGIQEVERLVRACGLVVDSPKQSYLFEDRGRQTNPLDFIQRRMDVINLYGSITQSETPSEWILSVKSNTIATDIVQFFTNSGIVSLVKDDHKVTVPKPDRLIVRVKTPVFDPLSWLHRRISIKSRYGVVSQTQDASSWILHCETDSIATSIAEFMRSKSINATTNSQHQVIVNKVGAPKISVISEIKAIQLIDQELRTQIEEQKRTQRIVENSDETILSPTTTLIEDASLNYMAEISGGSLRYFLLEDSINERITYSNDAREMNRIFGIRAARNFLTLEIEETWSNSGAPLQPVTIATIVSVMTYSGSLTPSSFSGNTSVKMGFLGKASIHAAQKWLSSAALNAESDHLLSVASCQIVGKRNHTGTGSVDLVEKAQRDYKTEATISSPLKDVEPVIREFVVTTED